MRELELAVVGDRRPRPVPRLAASRAGAGEIDTAIGITRQVVFRREPHERQGLSRRQRHWAEGFLRSGPGRVLEPKRALKKRSKRRELHRCVDLARYTGRCVLYSLPRSLRPQSPLMRAAPFLYFLS
jgi:hypothetical protein